MSRLIYLDNAATTKTAPEVVDAMIPYFTEHYGNPSSVYSFASGNKEVVSRQREIIAQALGAQANEIYFTAGGSESDNWALKATAEAYEKKGKHIITTKIEHHAILHTCEYLEKQRGFEITYLDVDENGVVKLDELKKAIRPDTILISVMFANNEIGTIQPIREIGEIAQEHKILFHTDAVQAFGQIPIDVDACHIDMLSASGHKLNGPKGIGFLYIKEGTKISPIIFGGGQQKGMRSGTENVPGIVGLAVACEKMIGKNYENAEKIREVKEYFQERIKEIEDIKDNSGKAPHVASISFKKLRSEVLLHALEDREIYVSSGSACSSNKKQAVSGTLNAIALSDEFKDGTLRFSFSIENTKEEVDETIKALKELVPMLRRFVRK